MDRTSPDSLAPWLLLLEKRAPFVVHEIDPRQRDTFAIPTNPSGVLPMWVDADTSCVWGASTVMRFVCDKHHLSPGAYAVEDFHRKTKTNMAIDWCVPSPRGRPSVHAHMQGCIGTGGSPLAPLQGAQPMPSHCLPDGKCQLQWHL